MSRTVQELVPSPKLLFWKYLSGKTLSELQNNICNLQEHVWAWKILPNFAEFWCFTEWLSSHVTPSHDRQKWTLWPVILLYMWESHWSLKTFSKDVHCVLLSHTFHSVMASGMTIVLITPRLIYFSATISSRTWVT